MVLNQQLGDPIVASTGCLHISRPSLTSIFASFRTYTIMEGSRKSVWIGVMIVTGSTIGAGMFSLPVVSSGMWFILAMLIMPILWMLNYLAASYLLEINMQFAIGSSVDTFVSHILGRVWNIAAGLGVAFLMYILLYAFYSAFGNMASHTLGFDQSASAWKGLSSFLFGGLLAVVVWASTSLVGRISSLLVVGMGAAFIFSSYGMVVKLDWTHLTQPLSSENLGFIWAALPYFLTSFGFASIVPSLYKFYGRDPSRIRKGLFFGSFLAYAAYVIFLIACYGLISREEFKIINAEGGNMGTLVAALQSSGAGDTTNFLLSLFSNFAIISSFLGVGLSLFDYVADRFSFENTRKGRLTTALITFMPPGLASFFFPNGFIAAIGFAGLTMVFTYFLVPFLMIWKTRKQKKALDFQVGGGKILLLVFLSASLLIAACQILSVLNVLPKF